MRVSAYIFGVLACAALLAATYSKGLGLSHDSELILSLFGGLCLLFYFLLTKFSATSFSSDVDGTGSPRDRAAMKRIIVLAIIGLTIAIVIGVVTSQYMTGNGSFEVRIIAAACTLALVAGLVWAFYSTPRGTFLFGIVGTIICIVWTLIAMFWR